jgi:signal transduction histidine kinase
MEIIKESMTPDQRHQQSTSEGTSLAGRIVQRPALAAGMFLTVGLVLSCIVAVLILNDLRHRSTLESARSYSAMLTVFRDYYSKVVIGSAKKSGVPISTQYHDIDGAIPPPATMTIELSSWVEDLIQPGGFRWFSKYPFLSRSNGGPRSPFEKEALQILTSKSARSFMRVESVGEAGVSVMRFAQPINMGRGCVDCHNSHPDSARKDWKIGDIRGVQVVSLKLPPLLPSPADMFRNERGLFLSIAGLLAGIVLISIILLMLMHRLRRAVEVANRRNQQLVAARQIAEHAADTKSRIMANVSHELRTPMNAIVGFSQLMSAEAYGPIGNDRYREYVGNVHDSAQSLMSIMENMIVMAELDSGETEMKDQAVDTGREMQRILALLTPDADESGVTLAPLANGGWPMLAVDLRAFRQIMVNLTSNAVQHAGSGAVLRLSTTVAPDAIEFMVVDDGVGIARDDLRRIMRPFEGAADPGIANPTGLGLGLNVARELSALLGGSLRITTGTGEGVSAKVSLPISRLVGIPTEMTYEQKSA